VRRDRGAGPDWAGRLRWAADERPDVRPYGPACHVVGGLATSEADPRRMRQTRFRRRSTPARTGVSVSDGRYRRCQACRRATPAPPVRDATGGREDHTPGTVAGGTTDANCSEELMTPGQGYGDVRPKAKPETGPMLKREAPGAFGVRLTCDLHTRMLRTCPRWCKSGMCRTRYIAS
jgi:hypothetical protein